MVTETVSGLGTSPVDIQLFNCSNVQTSSSGPTTFTGTNPGGTGNYAVQGSNGGKIIVVNGAPTNTTNNQANGVTPSNGTVTFSFTDGSQECVVPVVFQQTSNDELPLGTNNAPTVPFGVGQFTSFLPAQAAPGVITGSASSDVTSAGSNYFVQGGSTYSYGPNDTYQLYNSSTKTCATDSYSDFQQRLSQGDYVTGVYNPSATSTFCLNDVAPTAPANVYTAPPGTANTADTGSAGIEVIFSKCSTSNVTSYNVYRATAIPPTITGQPITCPTPTNAGTTNSPQTPPGSPYSKIGSVSATATQERRGSPAPLRRPSRRPSRPRTTRP